MDKHRQRQLDEELPGLAGPDYVALVIEWDDLADADAADAIEDAPSARGTAAAPRTAMSIMDNDPDWNRVDQASLESFPASDPPAWGSAHAVADAGIPEDLAADEITSPFLARPRMSRARRILLGLAALAALVSMVEGLRRLRPRA